MSFHTYQTYAIRKTQHFTSMTIRNKTEISMIVSESCMFHTAVKSHDWISIAILWWRRDWAHTVSALFRVNGTLVFSVCRNLTICLLFSIMSTESQLGAPICNSSPCNVWVAERTRKFNQIFIYLFRQWTFSSL